MAAEDAKAAAKPAAKPKAKKPAAKKPSHPSYDEMVLKVLKEGKKSLAAIRKGVCGITGSANTPRNSNYVRNAVKKLLKEKKILHSGSSDNCGQGVFKLNIDKVDKPKKTKAKASPKKAAKKEAKPKAAKKAKSPAKAKKAKPSKPKTPKKAKTPTKAKKPKASPKKAAKKTPKKAAKK